MAGSADFHIFNQSNGISDDGDLTPEEQTRYNVKQAKQRGGTKPDGKIFMGAGLGGGPFM